LPSERKDVMEILHYAEESVSVALEEIKSQDWAEKVYKPDIQARPDQIYKKPGYGLDDREVLAAAED
jgi:4-oxalocrotonate tautomerase